MDPTDHPAIVGLLATASVIVGGIVPVIANPGLDPVVLRTYLGFGVGGYWVVGGIAAVLVIVFAAGVTDRTDPVQAAGIALGGGLVMVVAAAVWSMSVEQSVAVELVPGDWIRWHRHAVLGIAAVVPVASGWWSYRLGVLTPG